MQRQNLPGCRVRAVAAVAILGPQYVVFYLSPLVRVVGRPCALRQPKIDDAFPDHLLGDIGMNAPDRLN